MEGKNLPKHRKTIFDLHMPRHAFYLHTYTPNNTLFRSIPKGAVMGMMSVSGMDSGEDWEVVIRYLSWKTYI